MPYDIIALDRASILRRSSGFKPSFGLTARVHEKTNELNQLIVDAAAWYTYSRKRKCGMRRTDTHPVACLVCYRKYSIRSLLRSTKGGSYQDSKPFVKFLEERSASVAREIRSEKYAFLYVVGRHST